MKLKELCEKCILAYHGREEKSYLWRKGGKKNMVFGPIAHFINTFEADSPKASDHMNTVRCRGDFPEGLSFPVVQLLFLFFYICY
jgi:hypothetical protein